VLLVLAYGADRLLGAEGRLLPILILAIAPPIGWIAHYELPEEIRSLGLVMFIYVVGLETGRRSCRRSGGTGSGSSRSASVRALLRRRRPRRWSWRRSSCSARGS